MQSQETNTRSPGTVNHPSAEEWMSYVYREVPLERAAELRSHLEGCTACSEKLNRWCTNLAALDEWKLPVLQRRKTSAWRPATFVKWAAAATLLLCVGFAVGQASSSNARELSDLKIAVAQLTEKVADKPVSDANNQSIVITKQTRDELAQLLADYSKLNEERRTEDRRVVGLALREMDLRLGKLRAELETVALNTESGFRQTKAGLTTLASYAAAEHGVPTDLQKSESRN